MVNNLPRRERREVLDCGGPPPLLRPGFEMKERRRAAAVQDAGALALRFSCVVVLLLTGCTTPPHTQIQREANSFPAEARITQRGVLTVLGRQFTLNGYLALSAAGGQRLLVTENFGSVLADVLVKPDGTVHVMRSSRAFKPNWIRRYLAADLECLFGTATKPDCPGQRLSPTHFRIERRWYQLDLQIVEIKPGPQAPDLFDASKAGQP